MRSWRFYILLCGLLFAVFASPNAEEGNVPWSLDTQDEAWAFESTGGYEGGADRRGLFVLRHPWSPSQEGQYGMVSREVRVPETWDGRVRVHFYMTDDYDGHHSPISEENWLGQINLVGHRFKQVLVDDEVVWEQDVMDPEGVSEASRFSLVLPAHIGAGSVFRLGFRMIDKVGSSERLPDDFRHIGATEEIQESDPWRFMTHVYVGDLVLTPEDTDAPPPSESPSAALVRARHTEQWPPSPYGEEVTLPVALTWEGWERVTPLTAAIHCGVPLPAGQVHRTEQVVVRDGMGQVLPLQVSPMNRWPDGSLRWMELDLIAPAEERTRRLMLGVDGTETDAVSPSQPVSIDPMPEGGFVLRTGATTIQVGGADGVLVRRLACGGRWVEDLRGEIQIDSTIYRPEIERTEVLARGPIRAEVELSGMLRAPGEEIGYFVCRLSGFAGQPYVRMTWRIFNERAKTLRVSRFELLGDSNFGTEATSYWGTESTGGGTVCLTQLTEDRFEVADGDGQVIERGDAAAGWLAAADRGQTMMVLVRHFRPQFPKALALDRGRWRIALFEAAEEEPYYLPTEGEAKRHEIWLGIWPQAVDTSDMARIAASFARPPRLFDAGYFCASGGLGYAAPHDETHFSEYDRIVTETYGGLEDHRFYVYGLRHWGDLPYGDRKDDKWRNGYYDGQRGFASAYLMSGNPRWFDHLEALVRHIMDVDVCHASAAEPLWVGSIHGYSGPNHTSEAPWNPIQRTWGTLAYWRMSADRDAREAALDVAGSAARSGRGIGARSVRDHGGILYCLTAAYDETHDERYLEAARDLAQDAIGRLDRRRGCYPEVHGNLSYRGNVPWMVAQLAEPMYYYYRQSGDVEAAVAVVGMAESILTENRTRGVPGDVHGYSHNPHYTKNSGYHTLIAPAILYAYELTGDEYYLQQARAMYTQMIAERSINHVQNCTWNTPTLLYYLQRYGME